MKQKHLFSQTLMWTAMGVVIAAVIATGILTNTTLRSIEKNLPPTLLKELLDLTLVLEDLAEVVSAAELTKTAPTSDNFNRLRSKIRIVYDGVVKLRYTYVFDNLIQASAFHAVVAPAIADLQIWLTEGVSGYGPETDTTVDIALSRISRAFQKARTLNHDSQIAAQKMLDEERNRLEQFLFSVNLLFMLTLAITAIMVFLLIRQHILLRREVEAQAELRRAEQSMQESEELFSKLIAAIPDVVVRTDVDGQILFVNEIALQISGYNRSELVGKNIIQFVVPEEHEKLVENLKLMFDRKLGPREYHLVMASGEKLLFEINSDILRKKDGSPYGIVNVCRDITERKQVEDALRESETKYRLLIGHLPNIVFKGYKDGSIDFMDDKIEVLTGYSKNEFNSRRINWLDIVVDEDKEKFRHVFITALKTNKSYVREYRIKTKAEEILWIQEGSQIVCDESGEIDYVGGAFVDITEHRKLEIQLQEMDRFESIGTLAGGIAHDFNNLLMGIQGRVSLMLMNDDSSRQHFEHLKGIEDYVKSAADLTKQLLGFARGGKYEVKAVDLNALIKKQNWMFGRTRKEITIHGNYEKNLWTVEIDQGQIEQVLLNIYVNAWQAMPGGGDLYIKTENIVIDENDNTPYQAEPGRYSKISITDTGVGMDEATRQRIFDPFFTTKEITRGTGLGLASVYGIVKNHDGFINVYSEKGAGSTFSIHLPASEKEAVKGRALHEEFYRGAETLLLVDDEDMILDVGCGIFENLGYTVLTAKSGKEAVAVYEKNRDRIDMVILDMIMPGMGGGETFNKLKEINPNIKVLLSSGYSIDGQATEILERGCNGFIQKPFNMADLSKKIRGILDKD